MSSLGFDAFQPQQWHDFLLTVGGGAAALTGLVFVAMSLNLPVVVQDATHRYRAIGTLSGFVAVFVMCALALMGGQGHIAVGLEWVTVSLAASFVYVYGYIQAIRKRGSSVGLKRPRLIFGTACYVAEVAGAIMLTLGIIAGLYVTAIAMVVLLTYTISGAWLLIVGASNRRLLGSSSARDKVYEDSRKRGDERPDT